MVLRGYVAAVMAIAVVSSQAAAQTLAQKQSWKCSAPGLVNSSYDGGSQAYIRLSGFSYGGNYAVSQKGNVATGVTANGTRFTCRLG